MRFISLNLRAYGHLENRHIELADQPGSVHVIYGPNEAGKTTIKSAIEELLFGFHTRTPYDFALGYAALRLEAEIENAGGERLRFIRIKKNKSDILNVSDKPLPDDALAPYMRGVTREMFARQFSLSRQELIDGSREIEEGRGDVGQSLYSAALGNASISDIKKRLHQRREEIYTPQGKKRRLNDALTKFEEAKRNLTDALVRPQKWDELVREQEAVVAKLADVDARIADLARTIGRCTRLQAQAQSYERLVLLRNALAAHIAERILSERDIMAAESLIGELARASAAAEIASVRIDELQQDQLPGDDDPILAEAMAIRSLTQRIGDYQAKNAELERKALRQNAMRDADEARQKLARVWPNVELDTARQRTIPQATIARAKTLATAYTKLSADEAACSKQAAKLADDVAEIERELAQIPSPPDVTTLRAAVDAGLVYGDLDGRITRAQSELDIKQRQVEARLQALGLFAGDLAELARTALPLRETIERFRDDLELIDRETTILEQRRTEGRAHREDAVKQLRVITEGGVVRTTTDLADARRSRDDLFEQLATQWRMNPSPQALDAVSAMYRPTVRTADTIADELRDNADRVAQLVQWQNAQRAAESDLAIIDERLCEKAAEREELYANWRALWVPASIVPRPPSEMLAWLQQAQTLRSEHESLDRQRVELKESLATREELNGALADAVTAAGSAVPPGGRLEPVLAVARKIVAQIETAETKRAQFQESLARSRRDAARLERDQAVRSSELATLKGEWQKILDQTWLPHTVEPDDFNEMIMLIEQFRNADGKAQLNAKRADEIEHANAKFRADVVAFSRQHAPDLLVHAERAPDTVATALLTRLEDAKGAHDQRVERAKLLATSRATLQAAQTKVERFDHELSLLANRLGIERGAVESIVEQSKNVLKMRAELAALQADVETGTGLSLEACDAEYRGRTRPELDSELAVAEQTKAAFVDERDEVVAKKREIEAELAEMDGSEKAVRAEGELLSIGAAIDQEARQWAELSLAHFALEWQIREYAEKNQSVLLARAGEFFRRLTAGAYPRLRADTDGGKNYLEVIDENEQRKRVDGLSEGTRDQLYFALRLATLEQYFGNNEAIPVILDDTFVAFDDRRSVLAFEVLAEFAQTTQVIYFTHHRACVEAARAAIPRLLHVHELEDRWTGENVASSPGLAVELGTPLEQPQRLIPHSPSRKSSAEHAAPSKPRNVS